MARNQTFNQLTQVENSTSENAGESINHTFQYEVQNIGTNVEFDAQGSVDGVNFFRLFPDSDSADVDSNATESNGAITVTANGTYYIKVSNTPLSEVRVGIVSESGTNVTVDAKYMGE